VIRQAHTYLVGALSGVTLIAIAIGAFIVLASAQVFQEWPIANPGGQHQRPGVAAAKALPGGGQTAAAGGAGTSTTKVHRNATKAGTNAPAPHSRSTTNRKADPTGEVENGSGAVVATTPTPTPSTGDDRTSSGGGSGSHSSQPSTSSHNSSSSTSPTSPNSSSGSGGSNGSSGSSGTGTSTSSGGSSGSGGSGGSGSGGGGTSPTAPLTAGIKIPPVAETVNETVNGVDETVLGGTLEETGVSKVTEEVVNGVAGPESVVGQAVEGVNEAAEGLLGAGH
jgi:hypothetical protein